MKSRVSDFFLGGGFAECCFVPSRQSNCGRALQTRGQATAKRGFSWAEVERTTMMTGRHNSMAPCRMFQLGRSFFKEKPEPVCSRPERLENGKSGIMGQFRFFQDAFCRTQAVALHIFRPRAQAGAGCQKKGETRSLAGRIVKPGCGRGPALCKSTPPNAGRVLPRATCQGR